MSGVGTSHTRAHVKQARFYLWVFQMVFSSPVGKYRKSYCSHPGVGIHIRVRVAQMLKFLIKVFVSLYLLTMLMDQVDNVACW